MAFSRSNILKGLGQVAFWGFIIPAVLYYSWQGCKAIYHWCKSRPLNDLGEALPNDSFQIYVRWQAIKTLVITVNSNDKTEDLHRKICEKQGDSMYLLVFNGTELKNGQKLRNYGIVKETTISASYKMVARESRIPVKKYSYPSLEAARKHAKKSTDTYQIFVKLLTGKTLPIDVSPEDTTDDLLQKVHDTEGGDRYRFTFHGQNLESGKLLSAYGIRKEETVAATLRLGDGDPQTPPDSPRSGNNRSEFS